LQDEQRQLRHEHETLRKADHQGNGHSEQDDGGPAEKKDGQPGANPQAGQREQPLKTDEKLKRPVRKRVQNFVAQHPLGTLLGAVAAVLIIVGSIVLWNYLQSYESTDDAQVDGHLNPITPRISGTVVGVYVENNQYGAAEQSLVDLDPRDYKAALERAKGAYAQAIGQLRAENPNVPIVQTTTQTSISTGQADVVIAEKAVAAAGQEYQARQASLREAEAQDIKAQRAVRGLNR
jgi:membrane fusion protein (multidrug efflux system)